MFPQAMLNRGPTLNRAGDTVPEFDPFYTTEKVIRKPLSRTGHKIAELRIVRSERDEKTYCAKIGEYKEIHRELVVYLRTARCHQIALVEDFDNAEASFADDFQCGENDSYLVMEAFHRSLMEYTIELELKNELMSEHSIWKCALDVAASLKFLATGQVADGPIHVTCGWRPIVHRDIKDDNIMQTKSGSWKIIDFGLVIEQETSLEDEYRGEQRGGTTPYLSPEWPTIIGTKSDVWALGVCIHSICSSYWLRDLAEVPTGFLRWSNAYLLKHLPLRIRPIYKPWIPFPDLNALGEGNVFAFSRALHHMICMILVEDPLQRPSAAKTYAMLKETYDEIIIPRRVYRVDLMTAGNDWFAASYPDKMAEPRQIPVVGGWVDMSVPGHPSPKSCYSIQ
jgi:serine/threonine protein kinase